MGKLSSMKSTAETVLEVLGLTAEEFLALPGLSEEEEAEIAADIAEYATRTTPTVLR